MNSLDILIVLWCLGIVALVCKLIVIVSNRYNKPKPAPDLVTRLRKYLGKGGIHFFWTLLRLTKTVSPVLRTKGMIPSHPVHFREGMTVRNWLRDQPECANWTTDDFDNKWADLVEKAVRPK